MVDGYPQEKIMSNPSFPAPYTWRPLQYEDLPALRTLLLLIAEPEDRVDSLADLQTGFDDPWSNPATDTLVAFAPTGEMAAFGRCLVHPEPEREAVSYLDYEFHPVHHSPVVEEALMNWLEARSRVRLQVAPQHLTRSLRTDIPDTKTDEMAMLTHRGFVPIRYFYRMRRELHQPLPEPAPPPGVTIQPYSADVDRAMLAVLNESFKDHWGHEELLVEDWEKYFVGSETFRPDFSLIALAGDEPIGMTFCTVSPEDNARMGRQEANIRDVGVLRAWRKRGVASALIGECLRRMRAAGLDSAGLGVDTANPTGALGLYEKLGFVPVRRFIVYDKPV
jgi:mycothiol synthase